MTMTMAMPCVVKANCRRLPNVGTKGRGTEMLFVSQKSRYITRSHICVAITSIIYPNEMEVYNIFEVCLLRCLKKKLAVVVEFLDG